MKAGLVLYVEGQASIDDRPIETSLGLFLAVNEKAVLRTGAGRAEVLLGPCAAVWVGENSSLRMISSVLTDTRIEVLTGSVVVGSGSPAKGARLTVLLQKAATSIGRRGAYRFDTEPPQVRVISGRVAVRRDNRRVWVAAGGLFRLDTQAPVRKFDTREVDPLDDWSKGRAASLARSFGRQVGNAPEPQPGGPTRLIGARGVADRRAIGKSIPPLPDSDSGCVVAPW